MKLAANLVFALVLVGCSAGLRGGGNGGVFFAGDRAGLAVGGCLPG